MPKELTELQTEEIATALAAGQKIQAIKLYREYTGTGLKEAKDFVEALEPTLRKEDPERFAPQKAQGKGCAAMLLALVMVGATLLVATLS